MKLKTIISAKNLKVGQIIKPNKTFCEVMEIVKISDKQIFINMRPLQLPSGGNYRFGLHTNVNVYEDAN